MYDETQTVDKLEEPVSQDSLKLYLQEIGRYPLLTRAEEVQLAKRVEAGDPAARQHLTESNLRLVVTIAKAYRTQSIDLLDLIQEGTLGLMRAADRYDWRRGTKFSTYAAWWIRAGIMEALSACSSPIRVPDSVHERVAECRRAEMKLTARFCRRPTTSELAEELGLTPAQVAEALSGPLTVGSLDEPVGSEGDLSQADVLADPNAEDPLQSLVAEATGSELEARLKLLPERSRRVIELRFGVGVGDREPRTAEAVAAELGVARERVRQIELHALRRLGAVEALAA
jgi:RNA polymerase primary sigma factor